MLISKERLKNVVQELLNDGILAITPEGIIQISPVKESEYRTARLQEKKLQDQACILWIEAAAKRSELTEELKVNMTKALPVFLRSLFIRHGVMSYELLAPVDSDTSFSVEEIALSTAIQFPIHQQGEIAQLLPTIFQSIEQPEIMEYLKHNINSAVGYISEVISDETAVSLANALKNLTLYLDTNTVYRLLNLQGQQRHEAVKETLDFCKKNGAKFKISAITKKELAHRFEYDAKVLVQFPTTTDLAACGYKYRTSDNYVSTFWKQSMATGISVSDFVAYYKNYDLLLEAEQIEVESIEVDEENLIQRSKDYFEKMSLRDPYFEKGDFGLWHDAYSLAYIQKMQKADAKTAIDTGCLFLTTDRSLTTLQKEDYELNKIPPILISPSQLLQIFSFTTPLHGYEETFIKFFTSSLLGVSFAYDNNDIQEILSRVGHYHGIDADIAEKILSREIINGQYMNAKSDAEREEIVYQDISDELTAGFQHAREQVAVLQTQNSALSSERETIKKIMEENAEQFSIETQKLQEAQQAAEQLKFTEAEARRAAEEEKRVAENLQKDAERRNGIQQEFYIRQKFTSWKRWHQLLLWGGIALVVVIAVLSIYFSINKHDNSYYGLLGFLAIPILMITVGYKCFSLEAESDFRKACLQKYIGVIEKGLSQ